MADQALAARPPLTRRQQEVVALLAAGKSDEEIAALLKISPVTVQTHLSSISATWAVGSPEELRLAAMDQAGTQCPTCVFTAEAQSLHRLLAEADRLLADISAQLPTVAARKGANRG